MIFQVAITETLRRIVPIEAELAEEAERIAEEEHRDEKHVLSADDFVGVEFKVVKE